MQISDCRQIRFVEPPMQIALLDILDRVPTHTEMACHTLNRHVARQLQRIALNALRVASSFLGKLDVELA